MTQDSACTGGARFWLIIFPADARSDRWRFLDWKRPALVSAAEWLREKYRRKEEASTRTLDLRGLIVVVPSGRLPANLRSFSPGAPRSGKRSRPCWGKSSTSRPVPFGEVLATLHQRLGIDASKTTVRDLAGRPQYLVDGHQPMGALG